MSTLVGLGGLKESGKDTVADILVGDYGFVKIQMSEPVSAALAELNPMIPVPMKWTGIRKLVSRVLYGEETVHEFIPYRRYLSDVGYVEAKRNPEVRRLLISLGTDVVRRMIDEMAWINIAHDEIRKQILAGNDVVVTGIRTRNELQMIEQLGGYTAWVERDWRSNYADTPLSSHDFGRTIVNDADIDSLLVEVVRYRTYIARFPPTHSVIHSSEEDEDA